MAAEQERGRRSPVVGIASPPSAPSLKIGPYVILETVSQRALCVIYRARHEELGRTVLLKTLKPSVSATSAFAHSIEREAKILAALRHESILALYDYARTPDAIWLALEDARGHALAEVLAQKARIGVDPAVAVALEIARGLAHAHERGTVHRDLRPDNVLLLADGGVKITEFSVASSSRLPPLPEAFEGDEAFGRPDYMAPEQILGEASGPRADVFSLGVMAYEMLAGERPFEDAADKGRTSAAPRMRTSRTTPAPLGAMAPEVPKAVERVVMRCLARDPEDRYESGRAAAAALEEALAELTRTPARVLVTRALAAARLGEALPAPGAQSEAPRVHVPPTRALYRALEGYLVIAALLVAGGAVIELVIRDKDRAPAPPLAGPMAYQGPAEARGYLRVLAKPWAEVLIDGEMVDTTPIGRPIPVSPGRHYVTFKHPHAPDEKRSIQVASGQTVVLDVSMRVDRAAVPDAGAPGAPDASASP